MARSRRLIAKRQRVQRDERHRECEVRGEDAGQREVAAGDERRRTHDDRVSRIEGVLGERLDLGVVPIGRDADVVLGVPERQADRGLGRSSTLTAPGGTGCATSTATATARTSSRLTRKTSRDPRQRPAPVDRHRARVRVSGQGHSGESRSGSRLRDRSMVMGGAWSGSTPRTPPAGLAPRRGRPAVPSRRPVHLTTAGITVPRSRNTRIRPKDTSRIEARRRHRDEQRAGRGDGLRRRRGGGHRDARAISARLRACPNVREDLAALPSVFRKPLMWLPFGVLLAAFVHRARSSERACCPKARPRTSASSTCS